MLHGAKKDAIIHDRYDLVKAKNENRKTGNENMIPKPYPKECGRAVITAKIAEQRDRTLYKRYDAKGGGWKNPNSYLLTPFGKYQLRS